MEGETAAERKVVALLVGEKLISQGEAGFVLVIARLVVAVLRLVVVVEER